MAHSSNKIAWTPDVTAPHLFTKLGMNFEEANTSYALQYIYDGSERLLGWSR